jgi:hypothetical protein
MQSHTADASVVEGGKGDQMGGDGNSARGWRWPGLGFWRRGLQGWHGRLLLPIPPGLPKSPMHH